MCQKTDRNSAKARRRENETMKMTKMRNNTLIKRKRRGIKKKPVQEDRRKKFRNTLLNGTVVCVRAK